MHHYDDPNYNYQTYWKNRDYEHQSEILAINKCLNGKSFKSSADIGGGFGRLLPTFQNYSKKLFLVEPSLKLRQIAKKTFAKNSNIIIKHGFTHKLPFKAKSLDLVSMIRVSHHLTDLKPTIIEINRVLKPQGYFLLELANSAHFKARLHRLFAPIPKVPIERRSLANINKQTIAFVNHHPQTILRLLHQHGFTVEQTLSVSNFRSPFLKKVIPQNILLYLESCVQYLGSKIYFGPSIFLLCHKTS